jgi:hypothetical protein
MQAGLSTGDLYSIKKWELIPIWLRIVIVGHRLEQLHWRIVSQADLIGHAYDRSGVHAAAELSKDRRSRSGASPDRLPEEV